MTYWPGETIEMDVLVSHFSRLDLSGCTLKYNLTGYPKLEGQMDGLNFPVGKTTSAGRVRLKSPGVQQPLQAALVFELFDTNGERAAFTTLDLTFLPRMQPSDLLRPIYSPDMGVRLSTDGYPVTRDLEEAGALVTRTLTDTVYRYAQAGGRVLWLADGEKPGQSFIPYRIRSRAGTPLQGDWASSFSWIRSGPVFKNIPAGGSVDFAFADLTPEQFIDGIPALLFHRNVHAGIFAGWIQKNAALVAELPVGKGRILVNTFRLSEHIFTHPIAAAMLQDMLNYLVE
jgi:hypothetical protein